MPAPVEETYMEIKKKKKKPQSIKWETQTPKQKLLIASARAFELALHRSSGASGEEEGQAFENKEAVRATSPSLAHAVLGHECLMKCDMKRTWPVEHEMLGGEIGEMSWYHFMNKFIPYAKTIGMKGEI